MRGISGMVLFEFDEEDLLSADDTIFNVGRSGDEWWKELSWEESNLFRVASEQSLSGLAGTSGSAEFDSRKLFSGVPKKEFKEGGETTVIDYLSNEFYPTSAPRISEPCASSSYSHAMPPTEASLNSCLKTDVQGRKHYHGLYALDMVEKGFNLSPPAGLWTHATHPRIPEQDNFLYAGTFTGSNRQTTEETLVATPLDSREFSSIILSPPLLSSPPSKRLKSAKSLSPVLSSVGTSKLSTVPSSSSCESSQNGFSAAEADSNLGSLSVYSDPMNYFGKHRKFRVPDPILSPSLESQIKRRPQKKKQYSRASPAKFCHLCARAASKNIRMVVCSNIRIGMCLKVTCEKCFRQNSWNFEEAFENPDSWVCTHCRGSCPYRAQCSIYQRTNHRRRVSRFLMKKQKELNDEYVETRS